MLRNLLIVGLGNPGKEYVNTRHNVGFMFLDSLTSSLKATSFISDKIFNCEKLINNSFLKNTSVHFIKPFLFMNNSGAVVKKYIDKNNILEKDLIVIYDDLDLKLGEYKIVKSKTPKQHNGVNSIITHIKSNDFISVRIGIDSRSDLQKSISGADYVLMKFTSQELDLLQSVFKQITIETSKW